MVSEFDAAHARVCALIDRFAQYASRYLQTSYQEAEARKDFIDPLFKALGWDVDHERENNPYEQEVKVERGVEVARSQKRADYAFHVAPNFRDVRFFVEAKKPSVDLARAEDAHFQIWRYGYSANTPLAILTDFEQLHVLDCRAKPNVDHALDRLWKRWHYTDWRDPKKFAEFYWLFSREAHAGESFQRIVEALPKPPPGARQRGLFRGGYQPVDVSFLAELEEHRTALAKAFKRADAALDSATLTEIVQRTLDRLVFLRFLEDKQIESEIKVSDFGKGKGAWADFLAASRRLDGIYNGIVFKRLGRLDDRALAVDDEVFADICERFAAENSPYNFDAIPIHILGSIYERFLGSVIRATAQRVFVEEKPEVRKAGGVYYTPEYIVRYIVAQTVGKQIEGKTPAEVAALRFADIACGSGSFLLDVYDTVLRHCADWYNRPENAKAAKTAGCVRTEEGLWRLSLAQRRAILTNNLYGVDIDRQAVEVAQLSLFLKLLEDERATSARQHQLDYARDASLKKLLPDLSSNVVCGNSLIGWDIADLGGLSPQDEQRLNPLDFEDAFGEVMRGGGFDAIVGNPPYVRIQTLQEAHPLAAAWLKKNYIAAGKGNFDIYIVFIERALRLLRATGQLGYIVPHKFFNAKYGEPLRGLIANGRNLGAIVHFGDQQVFAGATTYTCLLFLQRKPMENFSFTRVSDLEAWQARGEGISGFIGNDRATFSEWNFLVGDSARLIDRLLGCFPNLEAVAEIFVGVQTSADKVFHLSPIVPGRYYSASLKAEVDLECEMMRPILSGVDVDVYCHALDPSRHILFPYGIKDGIAELIPWRELQSRFPKAARYLEANKALLRAREGGKFADAEWYRFGRNQNIGKQSWKKLCVPRLLSRLGMASDLKGKYVLDNVDVCGLSIRNSIDMDLRYVLGVLNSNLSCWVFPKLSAPFRGGFMSANRQFLGQLPFRSVDFSDAKDKTRHDRIVALVDQMIDAKQQETAASGHAKDIATRKCNALDRQIDALVYELYGLTSEEIALVEGTA